MEDLFIKDCTFNEPVRIVVEGVSLSKDGRTRKAQLRRLALVDGEISIARPLCFTSCYFAKSFKVEAIHEGY